jgi:hypothetical protein
VAMETPIELMYKAAKDSIPAEALHVSSIANKLLASLSVIDRETAHAGEPALLVSMLHVGGDMHAVLQSAVKSMDNCSQALLVTANDYVATDAQARADYDNMNQGLRDREVPTHPTDERHGDPETPGFEVETPPYVGPPGQTQHVDPTEDPTTPDEDEADRGEGGEDVPDVPEVERDW